MKSLRNELGFALLSVFLIGLICLTLISIVFYTMNTHTHMSGQNKRYLAELESAKGVSEFIMASLRNDNLTCEDDNPICSAGDSIDLHGGVCTALGKTNCANISAKYLSKITDSAGAEIIAVEVISSRAAGSEKAVIEFVYKVF